MTAFFRHPFFYPIIFILLFITSCDGQSKSSSSENNQSASDIVQKIVPQIATYIVHIYEDRNGILWFGTMSKGVARYDRSAEKRGEKALTYITYQDGLIGNAVVSITEDKAGNIWFGTHSGLTKYNPSADQSGGKVFTNFTKINGLCHNRVANILFDSWGNLWIGTWGGVCFVSKADLEAEAWLSGKIVFTEFPLPIPSLELLNYQTTMDWVTEIMEDSKGNIWFGRDGYGALKYTPKDDIAGAKNLTIHLDNFTHFSKKDGLLSNNVTEILEDDQGNIWFGCRISEKDHPNPEWRKGAGGICRYTPSGKSKEGEDQKIIQFPTLEGLSTSDTYALYKDKSGIIWIGVNGLGLYRFDPATEQNGEQPFKLFKGSNRIDRTYPLGLQSVLKDSHGILWVGCSGGLFRLDESAEPPIINVTQEGPWN